MNADERRSTLSGLDPLAGYNKMVFIAIRSKQAPMFAVETIVGKYFQYGFIAKEDLKSAGESSLDAINDQSSPVFLEKHLQPFVQTIGSLHVPFEVCRNIWRVHSPAGWVIEIAIADNGSIVQQQTPRTLHVEGEPTYLSRIALVVANGAPLSEDEPCQIGGPPCIPERHANEGGSGGLNLVLHA